jgi:hypothetical protein
MWKKNFLFRAHEAAPLKESENELFHDAEPALDSAGLQMEKFLSVWVQGEGEDDSPSMYTNIYVRTATLDFRTRAGFLQPLQGRSHQIKQMLTPEQKGFLREWLSKASPQAWEESDDHFRTLVRYRVIGSSRMLKTSASGVLASFRSSTYRKGTPRTFTRCGLAGRTF